MKTLRIIGITLVSISIILNFQSQLTGFSILNSTNIFNPIFIITFLLGISMIAISGKDVTGGLEQALDNDVVGVVTFVRHGDKDKEGKLTEEGRKQARQLGTNFKEIYDSKNEGNIYLATSSSPAERAYETVKEIVGVESKYNKPIIKDERLIPQFGGEAEEKYMDVLNEKGPTAADDWYINSKYGKEMAEKFADFLESNKDKFKKLNQKGKKFHYIAGTHSAIPETLLKRIIIKDGKQGFNSMEEIGGTIDFVEPINFLLKKDGSYKINFRNNVYDVDMKSLHDLAKAV